MLGRGQRGQSSIEFLMVLAFAVAIIFLFIQLALNMSSGYIAHYATFMSARTFLVWDSQTDDMNAAENMAESQATMVFNSYKMKRFNLDYIEFGVNKPVDLGTRREMLLVGTYFLFKQKISLFSWIARGKYANMLSEAYLGKEPSRRTCRMRICRIMQLKTKYDDFSCLSPAGSDLHMTLFDDGC